MDTIDKLKILSADSQYDLACACGTHDQDHRVHGADGKWLYQAGLGAPGIPGETGGAPNPEDRLRREHRLYQVDFLIRKYGFKAEDIPFDARSNLSLDQDPKELWAEHHPEFYPVNLNRADRVSLLRVPGLGLLTVARILDRRREGRLSSLEDLNLRGQRLRKALAHVRFD